MSWVGTTRRRRYAAGEIGTRAAIEALGVRDYADLVIALAQADLPFPKPSDSARHDVDVARASAILQPLLRQGG
jgi:hypothetical protein